MQLKINVACDDICPKQGYRLLGEPAEKWFRQLNEEFGVKFDLFVPSCYHQQYPISEHKSWINELANCEFLSLNAHGHFHMTSDPRKFGECEWAEISGYEGRKRFREMMSEWDEVEINPAGWRNPGWLIHPDNIREIETQFDYVALHYEHNQGMQWNCKTFFGHDGIQQENISIHNEDMIMFQSHIAGKHNHNVWNEQNYEQLRLSLTHLFELHQITPKFLKECLND